MSKLLIVRTAASIVLAAAFASTACGTLQESAVLAPGDSVSQASLEECARADVVVIAAPAVSPTVSRLDAEKATTSIGTGGKQASVAVLGLVTIGTQANEPPQTDSFFVDADRRPVADRLAWVLVHRDLRIPTSGGPERTNATATPRYITVLASVVDADSGRFLRGWSCRWELGS
jgi:hypothetical protein